MNKDNVKVFGKVIRKIAKTYDVVERTATFANDVSAVAYEEYGISGTTNSEEFNQALDNYFN